MKKTCLLIVFAFVSPVISNAADPAATPTATGGIPDMFFNPVFYILGFLFLILFITTIVLLRVVMKLVRKELPASTEVLAEMDQPESSQLSWWTRFDRKFFTRAVPVEREKEIMSDHVYDGIQELDNDLPPWWKYGFVLTVIWGFFYLVYYHVTDSGALSIQEYKNEIAEADAAAKARMLNNANNVSAETVVLLSDADAISQGQGIFSQNCIACHGQKGEGGVGPNLTDDYWIHGGGIKNVFTTVQNGVPAKGMISWKSQLSPKQIQQVSSFIISLKGTKPENGKAPQGDLWTEQVTAPADSVKADSTKTGLSIAGK